MKKSKKLSLQSLALVLMSFILVAGVAFGMTGAWFQDADSASSNTITMGEKVVIDIAQGGTALADDATFTLVNSRGAGEAAMPGDEYTVDGALTVRTEGATSAMYVFVKMTAVDANNAFDDSAVTLPTDNVEEKYTGTKWKCYAIGAQTAATDVLTLIGTSTKIEISEDLTNDVALSTLTISYEVKAIQQANIDIETYTDDQVDAITVYTPAQA